MSDIETNRRVVVDYYQTAFAGNPEKGSPITVETATSNIIPMLPMVLRCLSASSSGSDPNIAGHA